MNKQKQYISFIIDELKKGNVSYSEVMNIFRRKWTLSESSFKRYWKKANEQHSKTLQSINEQKKAEYTKQQLEAYKSDVKDTMTMQREISAKIDALVLERENAETKDWRFEKGKPVSFNRPLSRIEQAKLDDTILKYRQELNKMIGAYKEHNEQKNTPLKVTFRKYSDEREDG